MSEPSAAADARPRTAVLFQWVGMGDLIWHVPYIRRIAETSSDAQVSLIVPPSTFARQLVGHESCIREVIDFDRHPRRYEARSGRHRGVAGLLRMARDLRAQRFDRIVVLATYTNRSVVAALSGIPQRLGYGTSWLQRRLLSHGPWIQAYTGPAVAGYKNVTAFAIARGFCDAPIVPRLAVRPDALESVRTRLAGLPRPLHALAIGSADDYKQWGAGNFAVLATELARAGRGVVLLGGPAERALAEVILQQVAPEVAGRVIIVTDGSVAESMALLSLAQSCIGNDTGAANISAAVGTPTWVVLGPRPPLEHDPQTLHNIVAPSLADIQPHDVARQALAATPAP
jgi:heptosyltransferase-2